MTKRVEHWNNNIVFLVFLLLFLVVLLLLLLLLLPNSFLPSFCESGGLRPSVSPFLPCRDTVRVACNSALVEIAAAVHGSRHSQHHIGGRNRFHRVSALLQNHGRAGYGGCICLIAIAIAIAMASLWLPAAGHDGSEDDPHAVVVAVGRIVDTATAIATDIAIDIAAAPQLEPRPPRRTRIRSMGVDEAQAYHDRVGTKGDDRLSRRSGERRLVVVLPGGPRSERKVQGGPDSIGTAGLVANPEWKGYSRSGWQWIETTNTSGSS
mmetsp:Transcript_21561/g.59883  ORF Transcript_21561/g.59883 Transcript_21561/m.59883 type:complete len:265 (-) Transcript_21561:1219-2013(-)